ncbi:MAG: class B sortase [Eubacterium sp.]|nr:class B sortase [Eubacterium sp.]
MEENKKKKGLLVLIIVIIAVIVVAGSYIGWSIYQHKAQQDDYELLLEDVVNAEYDEREGDAVAVPDDVYVNDVIDFDKLQSYNEELIAWIKVPNTVIDYPVARHESVTDQTYYLSHNMYKEVAFAGCIYMELANNIDFNDNNTILYGHNMKNDTMFGELHNFEDEEFFEENEYFYIYTPGHVKKYQIFAAYQNDNTNLNMAYTFDDEDSYSDYIKNLSTIRSMNAQTRDVELTTDNKLVTLSTCVAGNHDYRYLVQGVLIEDVETDE